MSHKLKLNRLFVLFVFFANLISAAQNFPDQFYVEYELTQSSKHVGTINIEYESKNKNYTFKAVTEGKGILRLLGNRKLYSKGIIHSKGFNPKKFELKNTKKPKKDISAIFQPSIRKIEIKYKGEKIFLEMKPKVLDIAIYLYQFNFEKKGQNNYKFNVLEGKKIREYGYKKIRDEIIEVNNKKIVTELYEGQIVTREKSKHYVWISKGKYRVPLKLRLTTDFGLTIHQRLVKTNIKL